MQTTKQPLRRLLAQGALLVIALGTGCGGDDKPASTPTPSANQKEREPGMPAQTPDEAPAPSISVAANDAQTRSPLDATPSPKGERVYYTALGTEDSESQPGVFSVAAVGGGEIRTLARGEPLTAPVNISVSLDGKQLFVADPAAGAVFSLPVEGGTPTVLAGTEGYAPRGLAVVKDADKREYLYFTGRTPDTQVAGLFRIQPAGGSVETLASGEPFADPAGVAVDAMGVAYVVETAAESASARVIRVERGETSSFVESIGIGFPAGITLTRDEKTLLVSGLDPATKHDVVYFVDTGNKRIERLTKTVGQFNEPAGLHRAHDADVFAWADSQANESGTVYVLTP
jgi:sugar lactone lactonase YvrE